MLAGRCNCVVPPVFGKSSQMTLPRDPLTQVVRRRLMRTPKAVSFMPGLLPSHHTGSSLKTLYAFRLPRSSFYNIVYY